MTEKSTTEIIWKKSPEYRTLYPDGCSQALSDSGDGVRLILRFTKNWTEISSETFPTEEISMDGRRAVKQAGLSEYNLEHIKIEEAAIVLTPRLAGDVAALLINHRSILPEEARAKIDEAFARVGKERSNA